MKSYSEITYRYLKHQKKRTILTAMGIVLSVALITAIFTMAVSLREKEIRDVIETMGDYHARFDNISGDKIGKIVNNVDIDNYSVTQKVGTAVISKKSAKELEKNTEGTSCEYLIINAFDSTAFKNLPISLKEGRYPQSSQELMLDISSLDKFENKPKLGDKLKLTLGVRLDSNTGKEQQEDSWGTNGLSWSSDETFIEKGEQEFTVVGISDSARTSSIGIFSYAVTFMDKGFWKNEDKYNIYVKMKSTNKIYNKLENIAINASLLVENKDEKGMFKYNIRENKKLLALYAQTLNPDSNKSTMAIIIIIVALIIICTVAVIYNAFHISVLERTSQFGILRCTGASPKQIRHIVFKEAEILSLISISLGLLSGFFIIKLVLYIVGVFNHNFIGDIHIVVSPYVFILATFLGIITVFFSAYGPARHAGRVSPMEAVRNTGNLKVEKIKKVKSSRLAKCFFGIEGELAYKNLRRNRKRFRITVFSMVISIVLFVVTSSFIDNVFNMNIVSISKKADFRVSKKEDRGEAIPNSLIEDIEKLPQVDKVYKYLYHNTRVLLPESKINIKAKEFIGTKYQQYNLKVNDLSVLNNCEVLSYGDAGFEDLKKMLREGKIDKEELNKNNGVILVTTGMLYNDEKHKSALMNIANLKVGDKIKVDSLSYTKKGEEDKFTEVTVAAIVEKGLFDNEYNNNDGINLITTEEVFKSIIEDKWNNQVLVTLKDGVDKQPVVDFLKELKEKDSKYGYSDYIEMEKQSRKDRVTIGIFLYGFIGVITLIGFLNIVNTISTNLILRTKELAMLKAVGMTRFGVEKLVALEATFYGIIAAFYGGIIGTGITYILFRFLLEIREFQWTMPWIQIFIAVFGAVVVALISGFIPLRRINKGNIIENIRMQE